MNESDFLSAKRQLQQENKKGVDFILAAAILWLVLSYIWTINETPYNKSIYSFMVGALLLPLAFGFSKLLGTNWKAPNNPLQPLGLWINFAQLFYFPFLIFTLLKTPDYFIMAYAIITGAHFFPYAWFYDDITYAIGAGAIPVTALLIALNLPSEQVWYIPLATAIILWLMAAKLFFSR